MDENIGHLALEAAGRLVDHDASIGQGGAHAGFAGREQQGAHGGSLTHAERGHRRTDELHRIVDRKARRHHATRGIDVERDLLFRVFRFEEQKLRDDQRGHIVLDHAGNEDDALLEQARINIKGPLAPIGLLNHHRHEQVHVCIDRISHS